MVAKKPSTNNSVVEGLCDSSLVPMLGYVEPMLGPCGMASGPQGLPGHF